MEKKRRSQGISADSFFLKTVNKAYKRNYDDQLFIFKEFSTICSQRWALLSGDEKKCVQKLADEANKDFEMEKLSSAENQGVHEQQPKQMAAKKRKVTASVSVESIDIDPEFKEIYTTMKQNLEEDVSDLRYQMKRDHVNCSGTNERIALRAAVNEYTLDGLKGLIEKAGHTKNIPSEYEDMPTHEIARKYYVGFFDEIIYGIFCSVGLCQIKGKPKSKKHTGWFPTPKLECKKCNRLFANGGQAEKHLDGCWFAESKEEGSVDVIYLEANSFDDIMRFDLLLPVDATFLHLDQVLREVWFETDDHLSQFFYDKLARPNLVPHDRNDGRSFDLTVRVRLPFGNMPADDYGDISVCGQTAPLTQCLTNPGQFLRYEFDFGDTSYANVKYRGIRKFKPTSELPKTGVIILQNEALKIPCCYCEKTAEFITSGWPIIGYPDEEVFCSKECATCAKGDSLCKIVNMPRCGFSGFHYDCTIRSEDDSDYEQWVYY